MLKTEGLAHGRMMALILKRWNIMENCRNEEERFCMQKAIVKDLCFVIKMMSEDLKCSHQEMGARLKLGNLSGLYMNAILKDDVHTFTWNLIQQRKLNYFMQCAFTEVNIHLNQCNVDLSGIMQSVHSVTGGCLIGSGLKIVGDTIGLATTVLSGAANLAGNLATGVLGGATHLAGNLVNGVVGGATHLTGGLANGVGSATHIAGNLATGVLGGATHLTGGLANGVGSATHLAGNLATGVLGGATHLAGNLVNGVVGGATHLTGGLASGVGGATHLAGNLVNGMVGGATHLAGGLAIGAGGTLQTATGIAARPAGSYKG